MTPTPNTQAAGSAPVGPREPARLALVASEMSDHVARFLVGPLPAGELIIEVWTAAEFYRIALDRRPTDVYWTADGQYAIKAGHVAG